MTVRGTLALLGLFAVLAAYVILVPAPTPHRPLAAPLLAEPVERVSALEIAWPDRRLRATRRGDRWQTDGGAPVAPGMVEDLLATLSTLRPTETLPAGEGTADYGLAPPAASLLLSAGGASVLRLEIGGRNPAWTGIYVRTTGDANVQLVGALLHWELEKLHAWLLASANNA
jgi:hypothetical protein